MQGNYSRPLKRYDEKIKQNAFVWKSALSYDKQRSDYFHASCAFRDQHKSLLTFFFAFPPRNPPLRPWPRNGAECHLITRPSDSNARTLLWGSLILPGSPSNFLLETEHLHVNEEARYVWKRPFMRTQAEGGTAHSCPLQLGNCFYYRLQSYCWYKPVIWSEIVWFILIQYPALTIYFYKSTALRSWWFLEYKEMFNVILRFIFYYNNLVLVNEIQYSTLYVYMIYTVLGKYRIM